MSMHQYGITPEIHQLPLLSEMLASFAVWGAFWEVASQETAEEVHQRLILAENSPRPHRRHPQHPTTLRKGLAPIPFFVVYRIVGVIFPQK